ncbi:pre-mRNA 3'-end-processing factor FIP1 isoform X12 [Varanus komodoensis]|uniref:pre-mRNA 3'-end-processing factor FIP1 isoform X12 n=1 Tax=Varanus komodoensis TaxID=61221 RepID=UPI001CF7E634|nr:pre-mRNA 3'-end-processing factor FIP1 isoform X12 [Varanus komodoensis]
MSAGGEVERLAADLSGAGAGDEEEEWLYGDENEEERPEDTPASAPPPTGNEEEAAAENGVAKTKVTETEDDSDSDSDDDEDDVQVTIGDIKTGAPQYGYGAAPVNLNIKTGGRSYGSSGAKVKGVDLDAPGSINGVPLLEIDLDSFEDKPWRKPGADLSDYFNYGFNEDTWKAYCEKQKRIRMGLEILPVTSTTNKIMVQQGRTGNMEKEIPLPPPKAEFTSPPPLFKTGIPSNRRLSGTIDVIGQTITISRVEGRRRANENSNIQVLSDRSSTDVDSSFSKPPPFFPPGAPPTHLPPPPFLPPPPSVSTAPPLIPPPGIPITVPPPGFPPPPGGPPPSLIPTIESGHSSGYDSRSARAFPYGGVRLWCPSSKNEATVKWEEYVAVNEQTRVLIQSPFRTLQVLHHRGVASWTQANNGTIIQEEIRTENGREIETEKEIVIVTGNESVTETESGSGTTVQLLVCSTVMRNDIGTENMQTEAMSGIEQAERKKSDTEKGDIEKRKKQDTSHHEATAGAAMTAKKETATGGTNTKSLKRAKKEKKQVVVNLPLNRKTLKLPLQNRHM